MFEGNPEGVLKSLSEGQNKSLDAVWDGELQKLCTERSDKVNVLEKHWGKVFGTTPHDASACDAILDNYSFPSCRMPWALDRGHLKFLLKHPKKSSPGPDGIPFLAYSVCIKYRRKSSGIARAASYPENPHPRTSM